jgi:hypothetical protein
MMTLLNNINTNIKDYTVLWRGVWAEVTPADTPVEWKQSALSTADYIRHLGYK